MKTRKPTLEEIEELVSFLPILYAKGFTPIKKWHIESQNGFSSFPWPEYDDAVEKFFLLASKECWRDYNYLSKNALRMLEDEDIIKNADIDKIKTMLTFCVRGERFCDGHWAAMIEKGYILRLLQRLSELKSKPDLL